MDFKLNKNVFKKKIKKSIAFRKSHYICRNIILRVPL
jgi:hypothetical protein